MQKRTLSADEISKLILVIAILLGGWFRFMPAWLAGFPVNDGGMFYTMMRDLQANHFVPPLYTTYNRLDIPFAYPPLALYIGASLALLPGVSEIEILRWLPAFVNALTIPVFYLLAKEILHENSKSAIATLAYALTPHLMAWLSMGGGITRSFGTLFMMLTALFSHRMFAKGGGKYILLTMLFGSLTALSHTESTIFAIVLPTLFWIFTSRALHGLKQGIAVGIGVVLIAGSWYGFVVSRHGWDPLLSALTTGGQTPLVFLLLFNFRGITAESFLDLLGAIGFLGLIFLIARRQYLIPVIYIVSYITQPRSAHTIVNIPLAMAAGVFIQDVLLEKFKGRIILLVSLAAPLLFTNVVYESYLLSLNHISKEERAAFQWIAENTPEDSAFLVLTGEPLAFCDSTSEWFPALTGRHSITTAQGREWVTEGRIVDFIVHRINLQRCLDEGMECLERESVFFEKADYIYISHSQPVAYCNQVRESLPETRMLIAALRGSPEYRPVYDAPGIILFEKKDDPSE